MFKVEIRKRGEPPPAAYLELWTAASRRRLERAVLFY